MRVDFVEEFLVVERQNRPQKRVLHEKLRLVQSGASLKLFTKRLWCHKSNLAKSVKIEGTNDKSNYVLGWTDS